jgi:hypothetical protein
LDRIESQFSGEDLDQQHHHHFPIRLLSGDRITHSLKVCHCCCCCCFSLFFFFGLFFFPLLLGFQS